MTVPGVYGDSATADGGAIGGIHMSKSYTALLVHSQQMT
jgi:hypothetical protein